MPAPGQTAKTPLSELWKKYGFGGSFTGTPVAPVPQPTPDSNDPWVQFQAEHGFPVATAESMKTPEYFTPQYLDWANQFTKDWYAGIAARNEAAWQKTSDWWKARGIPEPPRGGISYNTTTTLNGAPISQTNNPPPTGLAKFGIYPTGQTTTPPAWYTGDFAAKSGKVIQDYLNATAAAYAKAKEGADAYWIKQGITPPPFGGGSSQTTTTLNGVPISKTINQPPPATPFTSIPPAPMLAPGAPPGTPDTFINGLPNIPSTSPTSPVTTGSTTTPSGPAQPGKGWTPWGGLLYNYPFNPYKPVTSGEPAIGSGNQALQSLMDKSKDLFSGGIPGGMGASGGSQNWVNMF